ncbi:MAG: HD domain-containing protein [Candidatus Pacebacteria bacterium]|nr:HD domain-containing protein [Candidatus Paceibacterota bacterium]
MTKNKNPKDSLPRQNINYNKITDLLFEVGTLRNMRRMHSQTLPQANDTIASHSFETAIIGMLLAKMENADENKVLKMCLFHDIAETRTGDANFIHSHYVKADEEKVIRDQYSGTPLEKEIIEILDEYNKEKSKEAIIAKDADSISQIISQCNYLKDSKDLARWNRHTIKRLKTKSAKKLAKTIINKNSFDWFYNFSDATK